MFDNTKEVFAWDKTVKQEIVMHAFQLFLKAYFEKFNKSVAIWKFLKVSSRNSDRNEPGSLSIPSWWLMGPQTFQRWGPHGQGAIRLGPVCVKHPTRQNLWKKHINWAFKQIERVWRSNERHSVNPQDI